VTRTTLLVACAAVMLLAAALRLQGLDEQSLWTDEIYSVESSRWALPILLSVQDGHPPLYGLILKGLDQIAPNDLNGRYVSAFAGIAAVGAMLALGCAIADRPTAVVAGLLLAVAPLHVWYSREGRMYSLVALCALVASWFFVRALRGGGWRSWTGFAVVSALGLTTHYLYGAVLLAQGTFVAIERFGDALALRRFALVGAMLVALAVLGLPLVGQEAVGFVGHWRSFEWLSVPYTVFTFFGGFGLGPPVELLHRERGLSTIAAYWPELLAVAAVALAVTWAAIRALPSLGPWGVYLVLWVLVPMIVVFGGAYLKNGAFNVRYLFSTLPAVVLLTANGIVRAPRRYGLGLLAALLVLDAVSIHRDRYDPRYVREDLRGTAAYLRQHASDDRPITVSAQYVIAGLRHYQDDLRLEPLATRPVRNAADAEAMLDALRAHGGWLVLSREWEDDPGGYLGRAIAARAPGAETTHFPGIRVFHFDDTNAAAR
jgi:mannosyltransferase